MAPSHLPQVESVIGTIVGRPVKVGSLQASWRGLRPVLILRDFRLRNEADSRDLLTFTKARLQVDFAAMLRRQTLALRLLRLYAQDLTLVRANDGAIGLEGFDPHNSTLARWLLQQQTVAVNVERVRLRADGDAEKSLLATDVRVISSNALALRQLHVNVGHMPQSGSPLQLSILYQGNLYTQTWAGKGYLKGRISGDAIRTLGPWSGPVADRLAQIDAEIWSQWMDGTPSDCRGSLDVGLTTPQGKQPVVSGHAGGPFTAIRDARNNWRVKLDSWHVVAPGGSWLLPPVGVRFGSAAVPGGSPAVTVGARALPLDALLSLNSLISDALPSNDWVAAAHPYGEVRDLYWRYQATASGRSDHVLQARVKGFGFAAVGSAPGISGVDADIAMEHDSVRAKVHFDEAALAYPTQYASAFKLRDGNGVLVWSLSREDWRVDLSEFRFSTTDFTAAIAGSVIGNSQDAAEQGAAADLSVDVDRISLDRLHAYLPRRIPVRVRDWMKRALTSGYALNGKGRLQGMLAEFPFDNGRGQANAQAEIHGGTLMFLPDWPALQDIEGRFSYDRRQLTVVADSATTQAARLSRINTAIAALGTDAATLQVNGVAVAPATGALQYLAAIPLGSGLSKELQHVTAQGDVNTALDLVLPFGPGPVQFKGNVQLAQNTLTWATGGIPVRDVNGSITFDQARIRTSGLSGSYRGRSMRVDADYALRKGADQRGWARLRGTTDAKMLSDLVVQATGSNWTPANGARKSVLFIGATPFTAELQQARGSSGQPLRLSLRTTMQGLAVAAPPPFGKARQDRLPVTVNALLARSGPVAVNVQYGERVSAEINLNAAGEIQNAAVRLGTDAPARPAGADFWLGGNLRLLSVTQWRNFLASMPAIAMSTAAEPISRRKVLDLTVQDLELSGHVLREVRVQLLGGQRNRWQVRLDGPDAVGTVRYYPTSRRLSGRFKRLWLRALPGRNNATALDPRALPHLELNCTDFKYQDIHLGSLGISARVDDLGVHFSRLMFSSAEMQMRGEGSWLADGNASRSDFDIQVQAPAVSGLLGAFGYGNTDIAGGAAKFHVSASWPGTPAQFELARLAGHLHMGIGAGRLLAVENRVGRIFGLLSINTFWRRLSLDFSDVFRKGFAFDSIEGDFDVHNGEAHTGNLTLVGPAARVEVRGETSLTQQRYDQRAVVTPMVSDTLPVAGLFFGPAGIGVGAMVFLAGKLFPALPENIDGMMRSEYSITGPWHDPLVKRLSGL